MNAWKYLCFFHMGRDLGGRSSSVVPATKRAEEGAKCPASSEGRSAR